MKRVCRPWRPGTVLPGRRVPEHILRPPYARSGQPAPQDQFITLHDENTIPLMRAAGQLARAALDGPPVEIALAENGARWVREEVDAIVAATLAGLAHGESAAASCPPPLPLRPTLAGTLQLVGLAVVVALGGCVAGIGRCASRRLAEQRPVVRVTQRKGFELTELM